MSVNFRWQHTCLSRVPDSVTEGTSVKLVLVTGDSMWCKAFRHFATEK